MTQATSPLIGPDARLAIGIVAPFDLELDSELWRWLPPGVDVLITRTPFIASPVTIEFAAEIGNDADLTEGVRAVTAGRARTAAYACTSASFVGGRRGEAAICETMTAAGAEQALTTSGAIVEALESLGVTRVSLATPYLEDLSQLLGNFLGEFGVTVVAHESLGRDRAIWTVPYQETADLIRRVDRPDAEAIVVSCTNLPTYDLIAPLEAELGKPIISANQATMWACLRRIGVTARQATSMSQHLFASELRPPRPSAA